MILNYKFAGLSIISRVIFRVPCGGYWLDRLVDLRGDCIPALPKGCKYQMVKNSNKPKKDMGLFFLFVLASLL
jgi:hypothetical protein